MSEYKLIEQALSTGGIMYIELLQEELMNQEHISSSDLFNSFFVTLDERAGGLMLTIRSDVDYMELVNSGDSSGVTVEWDDLISWAESKGFRFDDDRHKYLTLSNIAERLQLAYLTENGEKEAGGRRYNFIEIAFGEGNRIGVPEMIEGDIERQVEMVLNNGFDDSVMSLNI